MESMKTKANAQLGLLDSFMAQSPANDFLDRLTQLVDWTPIENVLQAMYPATTGRPPHAPLVLFRMSLLQHCFGLSDPQCEALSPTDSPGGASRASLHEAVPDESVVVAIRASCAPGR